MNIAGITKLSLLDYPGKLACTIFTPGCQFRCPFCHNGKLALSNPDSLNKHSISEVLGYLEKRKEVLDGVCITGGEPLLQDGLEDFIKTIKTMGYCVKLDTNGYFSKRLSSLLKLGLLDYVAMDIKNCPERYFESCGLEVISLDSIAESIHMLQISNISYEFRTTVVKELHRMEDIRNIFFWKIGNSSLYLQSFRDSGDLIIKGLHAYSPDEMKTLCRNAKDLLPGIKIRGV